MIAYLHQFTQRKGFTWIETRMEQMSICERGEMSEGLRADCLLALNILDIRLVLVSSAAYTTVKQKPVPNLQPNQYLLCWITY